MSSKKPKVEWYKQTNSLNEIYQQTGMFFSFVTSPKDGLKQCHQWVKCRDYLHDAVRACHTGQKFRIYGFFYDPDVNPRIDLEKMRMLVSRDSLDKTSLPEMKASMKRSLILLNHYEKLMSIGLSKVEEVKGGAKKYNWMFTSSKGWLKSPHLVSMYTFLIRLGVKEIKFKTNAQLKKELKRLSASGGDNDSTYLTSMWNHLDWVAKNYKKYLLGKDGIDSIYLNKDITINSFHNSGGIKSLIDCCTPLSERNDEIRKLIKKK